MTEETSFSHSPSGNSRQNPFGDCIFIKENAHLVKVLYNDILYISSSHVYVNVITRSKEYMVRASLADYLTRFDPAVFMRVHRSHAVNLHHLTKITASSVWVNGKELALSAQYREELLSLIRY
jgi:DNA-binding LytR/AlgR family response regulator